MLILGIGSVMNLTRRKGKNYWSKLKIGLRRWAQIYLICFGLINLDFGGNL